MKLWPSDSFEIHTNLSRQETIEKVASFVEPKKWFRFFHEGKPFQGKCSQEGFRITRIIRYRNSFLPIINGNYLNGSNGTTIQIKMVLHPIVIAFMCIWFGGVIIGAVSISYSLVIRKCSFQLPMFIPFAMLLFGIALVSGSFWFEAKKQKPLLESLFKTKGSGEQN